MTAEGKKGNIQYYKYRAGSRFLFVEVLENHLLHYEYRNTDIPGEQLPHQDAIFVSPMVARRDFPGQTGEREFYFEVNEDLCLLFFKRDRRDFLTTICPADLEKWEGKGLNINPIATQHVYGLGQHFRNPGQADGDWVGSKFVPGRNGNQMRSFANGAPIVSQIPVFFGLGEGKRTYALFMDQAYAQSWDLTRNWWEWRTNGSELRGFFIAGQDLPEVRRRYMDLVGRPPVPPKNILGYWVSEFGFDSFGEIDAILKGGHVGGRPSRGLFEDRFPVDGLACDLQWYGGKFDSDPNWGTMGRLEFDNESFPNAKEKLRSLRDDDGVELMLIEQSYVGHSQFPGLKAQFDELAEKSFLVKQSNGFPVWLEPGNPWFWRGGMIDWTSDAAAAFWHKKKRSPLIALGVRKHWTDLSEPEIYSDDSVYFGVEPNRHLQKDVHNYYGLKWAEGIARGYAATNPGERFYTMARAGAAGIQRFGAGMWSGDIAANQASFIGHINARMHMSLAGLDYYSSDIGGFHRRGDTIDHEGAFPELYTQWLAAGSLLDIPLRTHVWNLENNKPSAANLVGHVPSNLNNIRLRYELTPYYYSLAHMANRYGDPVLPPLVYYYQNDPNVRRMGNQVLIGKDLMMGIVGSYGETERNMYLPAGKWVDVRNAEWMDSGGEAAIGIPIYRHGLYQLPLFARAGAIIPKMFVDDKTRNVLGKRTDGSQLNELRAQIYADERESAFTLFEDDGMRNDTGVRTTDITQRRQGDRVTVKIAGAHHGYPGAPDSRENELEVVVDNARAKSFQVFLDGKLIQECFGGDCLGNFARNRIRLRTASLDVYKEKRFEIELEPTRPVVNLPFHCYNGKTTFGESIYVSGSLPELGEFDVKRAVRLEKIPFHWTWTGIVENLPKDRDFEWKCVKLRESDRAVLKWENGPNHKAQTNTHHRHGYAKVAGDLKL